MFKKLLILIGKIYSYICSPYLRDLIHTCPTYIYTGYHSRFFAHIGTHTLIGRHTNIRGHAYIRLGNDTAIGDYGYLTAWADYPRAEQTMPTPPVLTIGDRCSIGLRPHITCMNRIEIGNDVLTGPDVLITDNAHGAATKQMMAVAPLQRPLVSTGAVCIEDNVWIGQGAMIMPNVHIGKGAIIAANSVVTHDVPAYSVAAGIPAKVVKMLNE